MPKSGGAGGAPAAKPSASSAAADSAAASSSATESRKRKRAEYETAHGAAEGGAGSSAGAASSGSVVYSNKQRILVFGSRGMTARYRHLMEDVRALMPHHKPESKLDAKDDLSVVNDIAQSKSATGCVFFEVRKKRDLYLWFSVTPTGPSVRFHVVNVHTTDELRLTGNCLKGSRPILSFDRGFDDDEGAPHLRLIRELLAQAFGTPLGHPKSQPFHDHVMHFGLADGKVWYRHYQIVDKAADAKAAAKMLASGEQPTELVEIGPRFVLDPVRIFAGSMGGPTLWNNAGYVAPNAVRAQVQSAHAGRYEGRVADREAREAREARSHDLVLPHDPLEDVFE